MQISLLGKCGSGKEVIEDMGCISRHLIKTRGMSVCTVPLESWLKNRRWSYPASEQLRPGFCYDNTNFIHSMQWKGEIPEVIPIRGYLPGCYWSRVDFDEEGKPEYPEKNPQSQIEIDWNSAHKRPPGQGWTWVAEVGGAVDNTIKPSWLWSVIWCANQPKVFCCGHMNMGMPRQLLL